MAAMKYWWTSLRDYALEPFWQARTFEEGNLLWQTLVVMEFRCQNAWNVKHSRSQAQVCSEDTQAAKEFEWERAKNSSTFV